MPLYIHLFHGRKDPEEVMDDWGEDGLIIGPLEFVHITYGQHIKGRYSGVEDKYLDLWWGENDLIYHAGIYYGGMEILTADGVAERVSKRCEF